ncbi:MAG: hypothetical protein ACOYKN_18935 [Pirellula sp.]
MIRQLADEPWAPVAQPPGGRGRTMGARARLIMKLYHYILVNALLAREFGIEYREA